jgi:peptide/nickel transport system permease protein
MSRNRTLRLGACLALSTIGLAILSFVWTPHDPLEIDPDNSLIAASLAHPFGTDTLGRDVLSNIIVGSRSTLAVAAISVAISMILGVFVGIAAAMIGSRLRVAIMLGVDVVLALPGVLVAIVLAAVYGPSTLTATVAIGVALSAAIAHVTRRAASTILTFDYVLAARACGASTWRVITHHLLPNLRANLLVQASGAAAIAILAESTLSYLGLGTVPPTPSWGRMLAESQQFLILDPMLAMWPGVFIALTVLGFNLLGDGLRETLDRALDEERT